MGKKPTDYDCPSETHYQLAPHTGMKEDSSATLKITCQPEGFISICAYEVSFDENAQIDDFCRLLKKHLKLIQQKTS